ncbi:hypothetical protein [Lampropedia aestuarii]|uniref:hypothetical protein n=1 Tax=Lampropedia aestuarii TaxID=2562762 RepID=UPI00246963E6|nr:hypothetical protein [Lampropedia aestuarii]MDH5858645.1 hypothetical protein [Lampropedia aestuarii]
MPKELKNLQEHLSQHLKKQIGELPPRPSASKTEATRSDQCRSKSDVNLFVKKNIRLELLLQTDQVSLLTVTPSELDNQIHESHSIIDCKNKLKNQHIDGWESR